MYRSNSCTGVDFGRRTDIKCDGLVGVAAEAADFKVAVARVQRVAERRGWLRRPPVADHPLVPSYAGEPISFPARLFGALRRRGCGDICVPPFKPRWRRTEASLQAPRRLQGSGSRVELMTRSVKSSVFKFAMLHDARGRTRHKRRTMNRSCPTFFGGGTNSRKNLEKTEPDFKAGAP